MKVSEHVVAARIAWRHARKAKARTALIVVLVALPVGGLAAAGVGVGTLLASPEERATADLGSGDVMISGLPESKAGRPMTIGELRALLPPGSLVAGTRGAESVSVVRGRLVYLSITESTTLVDRPPVAARFAVLGGRVPREPGEVALSPDALEAFAVGVGDSLHLEDLNLWVRVVGSMANREFLRGTSAIAAPGTLRSGQGYNFFDYIIDFPPGVSVLEGLDRLPSDSLGVIAREDIVAQVGRDRRTMTAVAFGFAAVALFGTCLIAGAAFGVGARRQLRTMGLVGATGGEPRHVRMIVLWGGAAVGLVASLAGAFVGILAAALAAPRLDFVVGRVVDGIEVSPLVALGAVALGAIASTVAAYGPARSASHVSTIDALAGRIPPPQPAGRLARKGMVGVVLGVLFTGTATAAKSAEVVAIGLVLTLGGFLLVIPLLVAGLARTTSRLPTAARLAARQTVRYGRRTGAAVAAATIALTVPVGVGAFTLSDEANRSDDFLLAPDHVVVGSNNPADEGRVPDEMVKAFLAEFPGAVVAPLREAGTRTGEPGFDGVIGRPGTNFNPVYVEGAQVRIEGGFTREGGALFIGDEALLRVLRASSALDALRAGKVVAVGARTDEGFVHLRSSTGAVVTGANGVTEKIYGPGPVPITEPCSRPGCSVPEERVVDIPAVPVPGSGSRVEDVPRYMISEQAAAKYGLVPSDRHYRSLMLAPRDLTRADLQQARAVAARFPGGYVYTRFDLVFDATLARLLVSAGAALVALAIVGVAVALVSAESRREHAVLVAVGAGPGMRRRIVGANASLMALLAGVLAVPAGFLPVAVIQLARPESYPVVVPWQAIGIVLVAAPLLAGLFAALASREPKSRALLQPIW